MNYDGSYYYALGCVILTTDEGRKPEAGQLGSVQICRLRSRNGSSGIQQLRNRADLATFQLL